MLVTTKIKLDLQRPSYPVVVNAVQGEQNTRQLELSLYSGSVAWMVPDNVSVAMRYCKPDKTKGYYDTMPDGSASFTVSENRVSALLAPQMLTVPGTVVAQIVLHQGTQTLATFPIHICVEADPSAGAVTSEDYVNWAQWIESELDAYLEQLKTSGEFLGGTFVGDVNMNGHALSGLRAPVAQDDAATKEYVDNSACAGAVSTVAGIAPDTSGNVPLTASDVKALSIGGGIMEGPINMKGQAISGLNAPNNDSEAANKWYVDTGFRPITWTPTAKDVSAVPAVESEEHPGCYYRIVDNETEWLNPPCILGVDYRTTARNNGNPVYTKVLSLGVLSADKTINPNLLKGSIFAITSYVSGRISPTSVTDGDAWNFFVYYSDNMIKTACGSYFYGAQYTGYAQIWYCVGI